MSDSYWIRPAHAEDVDVLVAFTLQEAADAEGVSLDPAGVRRGVARALDDPTLARYWIAVDDNDQAVASASITREWSNFYGAHYWWVQSLFVSTPHRGRGLVDRLLDHLAETAASAGALDLRLYAHDGNARAHRVYQRCGFTRAPYRLMRRSLMTSEAPPRSSERGAS